MTGCGTMNAGGLFCIRESRISHRLYLCLVALFPQRIGFRSLPISAPSILILLVMPGKWISSPGRATGTVVAVSAASIQIQGHAGMTPFPLGLLPPRCSYTRSGSDQTAKPRRRICNREKKIATADACEMLVMPMGRHGL